jgi:hypothetical protein
MSALEWNAAGPEPGRPVYWHADLGDGTVAVVAPFGDHECSGGDLRWEAEVIDPRRDLGDTHVSLSVHLTRGAAMAAVERHRERSGASA